MLFASLQAADTKLLVELTNQKPYITLQIIYTQFIAHAGRAFHCSILAFLALNNKFKLH